MGRTPAFTPSQVLTVVLRKVRTVGSGRMGEGLDAPSRKALWAEGNKTKSNEIRACLRNGKCSEWLGPESVGKGQWWRERWFRK